MKTYQEFHGKNLVKMPELLAKGLVPGSTAEIIKHRLNNEKFFINEHLDTSDLIAYDSKERSNNVKFILTVDNQGRITRTGRKALDFIHPSYKLFDAAIDLTNKYDSLQGDGIIEVSMGRLGKLDSLLEIRERLDSKAWRILARHPDEVPREFAEDEKLLEKYSKWVNNKTKNTTGMAVSLDSQSKTPKLRIWSDSFENRFSVNGFYILNCDDQLLVGF